jgi:hypothetical protein
VIECEGLGGSGRLAYYPGGDKIWSCDLFCDDFDADGVVGARMDNVEGRGHGHGEDVSTNRTVDARDSARGVQ